MGLLPGFFTVIFVPNVIKLSNEIKIILINHSSNPFFIEPGDRIAQIVFTPYSEVILQQVENLPSTIRNEKGLGSTGVKDLIQSDTTDSDKLMMRTSII